MLKTTNETIRIRIHPSASQPKFRIKTESMDNSHVVLKNRDYCRRIRDLGHQLKKTSKRFQSEIRQLMAPQMVCHLELFFLIYAGSNSKIHKVRDKTTGCHYVLKKIEIDPWRENRQEELLKKLKSNFLVEIKDIYWSSQQTQKKELNILMKVYRYDLRKLLETQPKFKHLDIVIMFYQMARGVHYIHSKGICHRDVNSTNFLIDEKGRIYLSDFGSAKILKKDEKSISQIGTMGYRAPQLLLGSQTYTNAIDIWSLGCVFLQVISGQLVFNGSSSIDSLLNMVRYLGSKQMKKIKGDKQMLSLVPKLKGSGLNLLMSSWDSQLADLVQHMLAVDPNKRMKAIDILVHPFFQDLRQQQTYLYILREKVDISDFFNFAPSSYESILVQLKNNEQHYTKLIPIWKRDRPQKRTSNGH